MDKVTLSSNSPFYLCRAPRRRVATVGACVRAAAHLLTKVHRELDWRLTEVWRSEGIVYW